MTNEELCPECQRPLPDNAPAGICPHCLLQVGLESSNEQPGFIQKFEPPSAATLSPLFEQIEIEALLGQGGMGAVYRARQVKLDRLVALKILRPESSADESFAERFNREARTLAHLSHPQIIGVHDFGELVTTSVSGESQKLYYFLMEYVEGENLREFMRQGKISANEAISIVTQICEALQDAHEQGVIHRDIKPENILINSRGRVKIADFGLAKLATPSEHDFTLTGTHQVMGTPRYMAPEQMAGSREVDQRADIYSLGIVFYEMLTGDIPAGHFSPPSEQSDLDPRFDDVVYRMLSNRPENRFHNAAEILQAFQSEGTISSPVLSSPAHSRMGVSTIMEQGVAAAWGWVANEPDVENSQRKSATSHALPLGARGVMLLLCMAAIVLCLCPWMKISIYDTRVVAATPVHQLIGNSLNPAKLLVVRGSELGSGIISIICLTAIIILLLQISSKRRLHLAYGILLTISAVGAFLAAFLGHEVMESKLYRYRVVNTPTQELTTEASAPATPKKMSIFPDVSSRDQQYNVPLRNLDKSVELQPWYYGILGCSGLLVVMSAIALRNSFSTTTSETKEDKGEFWSATPLTSLRFPIPQNGEIASKIAFHFRGIGYEMTEELPDCWIFERGSLMGGLLQSDIRAYPTRLTVQAIDVDDQSRMISCHWSVKTMGSDSGKKDIRRLENEARDLQRLLGAEISEAAEREADIIAVEEDLGSVSLSLIIVGALTIIGHLIYIMICLQATSRERIIWFCLPGLFASVLMLVAGYNLQMLRSKSWVQVGVIAGMLPVTPTWVLSVSFCIWGLMAVSDPDVKQAFLTKRKRREEEEEERLAQWQSRSQMQREAVETSTSVGIDTFAAEQEVGSPALGMIIFGTLTMVGHLLMFIHEMRTPNRMDYAWMWVAGFLSGLTMFIGGLCMRRLTSISWARISVIAGALPTSPAWIINMFMSGWANQALQNTEVKAAFLEKARRRKQALTKVNEESTDLDIEALQQEVSGPSIALIISGVCCLLGHSFFFFMFLFARFSREYSIILLPGMITGIFMILSGLNFRNFKANGGTQAGIILGMLPVNFGWPITLPICIWANSVFHRPLVKQAFLDRLRFWNRLSQSRSEQNPGLRNRQ